MSLKKYGEKLYDNIIFFAPTTESFSAISFDDISEFVQEGGNVLVAGNKRLSDGARELLESFGISVDKKDTEVIDHFESYDALDFSRQHTVFLAKNTITSPVVLGDFSGKAKESPVVFKGVGHKIKKDNILAVRILKGNPSSYSYFPSKAITDSPESSGEQTSLVSGLQGRNNARVVFAGSLELFSNQFFGATVNGDNSSGNRDFCREVTKWGFAESGVLRFRNIVHHKSDGTPPDVILHEKERPDLPASLFPDPEITRNSLVYRIKDEIVYSMIVEEYKNGEWQPFSADDMQMEFVMLDAYVRKTMTSSKSGKFVTQFTAPDSYGVFKFRVLYRREGYTVLHAETQVSIRPFKHNEYERFIFSAYPYYASAFSATIAFVIFSVFFLFSSD